MSLHRHNWFLSFRRKNKKQRGKKKCTFGDLQVSRFHPAPGPAAWEPGSRDHVFGELPAEHVLDAPGLGEETARAKLETHGNRSRKTARNQRGTTTRKGDRKEHPKGAEGREGGQRQSNKKGQKQPKKVWGAKMKRTGKAFPAPMGGAAGNPVK